MNFTFVFFVFMVLIYNVYAELYDTFSGTPICKEDIRRNEDNKINAWCTIDIKRCNPYEGRRIDGSCNNLRYPTSGAGYTPMMRVLPAVFGKDYEPRKAASGQALPLVRRLRTSLFPEGRVPSQQFTQLATYFLVFILGDVVSQHDTFNYVVPKPYCCSERGKTDYACVPNKIPDDDPVHRFSSIRCLNLTRPETFQSVGCIPKGTLPERIDSTTPLLDLSILYGTSKKVLDEKFRTFQGGLLKYDILNGQIWPPAANPDANSCLMNQKPFETRCHDAPNEIANALVGVSLLTIWFYRQHNFIAGELAKVNPCWNDEKLFYTARDINIAEVLQIYFYELLPLFLRREYLESSGVISRSPGFRDLYNPSILPQMSLEYLYIQRWFHTIQEGVLKMYDTEGHYMKQIPMVNVSVRTGYFALGKNLEYTTQGSIRQGCAAYDHVVDPDIVNYAFGGLQKAADAMTNDLSKSRYFGFPPYVEYRELCFGDTIRKWEDLRGIIDPERIEMLRNVYDDIRDVELFSGMGLERQMDGANVPPTFYCLEVDQLIRNVVSDRHWYERPNRPNAFSLPQLMEIRKSSIARTMCDVGDSVSQIQRDAFLRISPKNKLVECSKIKKLDFNMWRDQACYSNC